MIWSEVRNRSFLLLDVLLLPLAVYASFVLRLEELSLFPQYAPGIFVMTVSAIVLIPGVFWRSGIYSRYWRYASVEEMLLLLGTVTLAVFAVGVVSYLTLKVLGDVPVASVLPRSIPFIFLPLALSVTASPRLFYRFVSASRLTKASMKGGLPVIAKGLRASLVQPQSPVLIMGAGDAGAMIVRELQRNPFLGMEAIGFLDDDLAKHDVRIHGVPVMGNRNDIPELAREYKVKQVIIAMPTAPGKTIREIVRICEQAGVETKLIPGIYELIGGTVSINQLRNVQIEDLLRRAPVQTDTQAVGSLIKGRKVLVTGAGGSIGSELCRQIAAFDPAELILLGHGENSIFEIHNELLKRIINVKPVIADIRFKERVEAIICEEKPHIIFHAAAHKHVPLMEWNPSEAITNNVLGTSNMLDAAVKANVERFIMISTDKAVNPSSLMGASKRVAEFLVHRAATSYSPIQMTEPEGSLDKSKEFQGSARRKFCAVRFGNVLGSRGSVVLTFKQQIAAGGPITITDPEMRRYFMTIPEAVQLVLQASVLGTGGEVFVLDMGEPIKIVDLATDLIQLSGFEVGRDIDIVFTGKRPGEKLFEELFLPNEVYQRTPHEKIFLAANASSFVPNYLNEEIVLLADAAQKNDRPTVLASLRRLIPEFEHVT